ncbi:MAG: carbohydrate-binding domain-containing protein [Paludibacteraceae bacterium]|nr:carbohydrate-binding domain-containing protein [Paludibacteraceae bacterium]
MKKYHYLILSLLLTGLTACSPNEPGDDSDADLTDEEKDKVENFEFGHTVTITFGTNVEINNPLNGKGIDITVSGNDVTCTSTTNDLVEYVLSGTSNNGSFTLFSDKRYKLMLNGLNLKAEAKPAISLQSSKRCYLVLADNTSNTIADIGSYDTDKDTNGQGIDLKATLFSEGQIIVSGGGTLNISSGNANGHAIATDDYLRMRSGVVNVAKSVKQALHVKDYWLMEGGTFKADNVADGVKVTRGYIRIAGGSVNLTVEDDGLLTTYGDDVVADTLTNINTDITIDGGSVTIFSTKTKDSGVGIRSRGNIYLNGGALTMTVYAKSTALVTSTNGCQIYRNGTEVTINAYVN